MLINSFGTIASQGSQNAVYGDGSNNTVFKGYGHLYINDQLETRNYYPDFSSSKTTHYSDGNVNNARCLYSALKKEYLNTQTTHHRMDNVDREYQYVLSGSQNYILQTPINPKRWVGIYISGGGFTTGIYIGSFKINVNNNWYTLEQLVDSGYIEPLVLLGSESWSTSYIWNDTINLYTGGNTSTKSFPNAVILFKTKEIVTSISFYANKSFSTTYDGFKVLSWSEDEAEISLEPCK